MSLSRVERVQQTNAASLLPRHRTSPRLLPTMRLLSTPLALSLLSLATVAKGLWPGVEQRYVDEHLLQTGSLGLPRTGLVAAFGDYNADQLVDLFLLSSDQREVSVWVWDRALYEWRERPESRIRTQSDFIVVNVVPGDFDYDGRLDVLLMGSKNPGGRWGGDETLEMQVYLQRSDGSFCEYRLPCVYWEDAEYGMGGCSRSVSDERVWDGSTYAL